MLLSGRVHCKLRPSELKQPFFMRRLKFCVCLVLYIPVFGTVGAFSWQLFSVGNMHFRCEVFCLFFANMAQIVR